MKKIYLLLITSLMLNSCNSGNETTVNSNDIIVGIWKLNSQLKNGTETINSCTQQTQFSFETNFILKQIFYNLNNTICEEGNEIVSSWQNNGNSEYIISSPGGSSRIIKFSFNTDKTEFSISENQNGDTVVSVFKKN